MANIESKKDIDTILTYILIKKLVTPIIRTDSYRLGMVNAAGNILREPSTPEEQAALTLLDKVVLKLKRLLGGKLLTLNNFLYLQTMNNDFYNKLVVRGSVQQRAEIQRITKDVKKIQEHYNLELDEIIYTLLTESLEENNGNK